MGKKKKKEKNATYRWNCISIKEGLKHFEVNN